MITPSTSQWQSVCVKLFACKDGNGSINFLLFLYGKEKSKNQTAPDSWSLLPAPDDDYEAH